MQMGIAQLKGRCTWRKEDSVLTHRGRPGRLSSWRPRPGRHGEAVLAGACPPQCSRGPQSTRILTAPAVARVCGSARLHASPEQRPGFPAPRCSVKGSNLELGPGREGGLGAEDWEEWEEESKSLQKTQKSTNKHNTK